MRYLLKIMRLLCRQQPGYAWRLVAVSIVTGVAPLINIFIPRLIIDELLGAQRTAWLLSLTLGLAIGNLVMMMLDSLLTNRVALMMNIADAHAKEILAEKALRIPLSESERKTNLDLLERARFGIYHLNNLDATMKKLGGSLVSLLSVLVIVLMGSPLLAFLILAINFPTLYCLKKIKYLEADNAERSAPENRAFSYFTHLAIDYRYAKDLKLYDGISLMMEKAQTNMDRILKINHAYFTKIGFWNGIVGSLVEFQSVAIFAVLGIRLLLKQITVGTFTMLYSAGRQMGRALNNILQSANELMTVNLHIKPLVEYLELPESSEDFTLHAVDHCDDKTELDEDVRRCLEQAADGVLEWRVEHVSFKYPTGENLVLDNCSLKIHSGERIALVGTNGAGKTTLVKLLCRYYEQQSGSITLNGVDIRRIPLHLYNAILSPTFQDFRLFAFQIAENISCKAFDKMTSDDEQRTVDAVDKLGLKEWVSGLPFGVNTYHSSTLSDDGVLPSGGQAQKIALARSLAHAGPFVIMDEPTAALDPKSEEEIFHQMLTLSEHTTSLFISHRLSSTRYADRILVLDQGCIVEQGSHRELLANGRLYARMYKAQAALYR
ncbi:MAG: ABC transporter ATP-binding protein [Clostridiaceae bacterium]|jgi:ATP-binding cassette subfamily B protein|nr:ABC transporter ATP-binding protein [Clostridiaceae bacterium]